MNEIKDILSEIYRLESLSKTNSETSTVEKATALLLEARELADAVSALSKKANEVNRFLKEVVVPARFEEMGVTSITLQGYRFTTSKKMRASIAGGRKEDAFAWLRDNDLGDIIIETVNAGTLSNAAVELLDQGIDLDPELFSTYYQDNTSITKVK